ncbi:MAG TPA: DUF4129 domain-containing protein [Acidimicrobiales bacterium]|nr:DUF4129 domain-containing protein [Acidimicrobiales bacterium]
MSDPAAGRARDGRRGALLVGLVVVAVAVVALAARGDHADGTSAAFALPDSTGSYVTLAVFVAAVAALVVAARASWPEDRQRGAPRKRSVWRDLAATVFLILVVFGALHATRRRPADRRPAITEPVPPPTTIRPQPERRAPRASAGASLALAALAIAGLGLAGAVLTRRRQEDGVPALPTGDDLAGATPSADPAMRVLTDPDDAGRVARDDPDPRRGIRAAYRAAELVLAPTSYARRASFAPREWVAQVGAQAGAQAAGARAAATLAEALARLVACYELARFSDHPVGEDDRAIALAALDEVRSAVLSAGAGR